MIGRSIAFALAFLAAHSSSLVAQGGVTHYCTSGQTGAQISASGSASFTANGGSGDLVLHASGIPGNAPGLFLFGSSAVAPTPFGSGFRCVGGNVFRLPIVTPNASTHTSSFGLDYLSSGSAGVITPGSTWNFQFWFRKNGTFDLTDAMTIDFSLPSFVTNFTTIEQGQHSGHSLGWAIGGGLLLIDNAADWTSTWDEHYGFVIGAPPAPAIDFTQDVVVAAFAGNHSTGGYSFAIQGLRLSVATLDVDTVENTPGPECPVTFALTQPYHFVRVPRVEHETLGAWNRFFFQVLCP